jgi:hypothetical protein
MIASTIKQLLVVFAATAIALYLLEKAKQRRGDYGGRDLPEQGR